MKTYDERMQAILGKARTRKRIRLAGKMIGSVLALTIVACGVLLLPDFGGYYVGMDVPTVLAPGPATTHDPTCSCREEPTYVPTYPGHEGTTPNLAPTVPTLTTVPDAQPNDPVGTTYPDFDFADLHMDGERVKLIEETWAEKTWFGFSEYMKFCNPESGVDGIRYYGSFTKEKNDGQIMTYDILYIPCKTLPVASQFTFDGHTFRSWNGFGLYVFYSKHMGSLDMTMNVLNPLSLYLEEGTDASTIEEDVLLKAAQMHENYERMFYGSVLTEMPKEDPIDDLLRLKATWLLNVGNVPTFKSAFAERYYGTFSGYDIVFMPTSLMWVETQTIGGESFTHSSSFVIYAVKDWQIYRLEDVYEQGLISQENIAQLAQIHREWKSE